MSSQRSGSTQSSFASSTNEEDLRFVENGVNTDELCAKASCLRDALPCTLGEIIWGGFNVLFELNFSDRVTWLARIPLLRLAPSELLLDYSLCSYVSTLNYIKTHTTVPVPKVFACHLKSELSNSIGVSYMLMERLPGHRVAFTNVDSLSDFRLDSDGKLKEGMSRQVRTRLIHEEFDRLVPEAESFHRQLAEYLMQLASHHFDKIGSIQEKPLFSGNFVVEEYFSPPLVSQKAHHKVWNTSPALSKGPFSQASTFYSAILDFNEQVGLLYEEEGDSEYLSSVHQCRHLADLLALPEFDNGPFVIEHDDLSSGNILVDDDFNITGIIDFPGTTVSLPSFFIYPFFLHENFYTPYTKREVWKRAFNNIAYPPGCPLHDVETRDILMEDLGHRTDLEQAFKIEVACRHVGFTLEEVKLERKVCVDGSDEEGRAGESDEEVLANESDED